MDFMVIKYLGLSGAVYGTHLFLAISQLLLGVFFIASGVMVLSSKKETGKWLSKCGFVVHKDIEPDKIASVMMIIVGIAFLLPVLGASYWLAIIACPFAIYLLLNLSQHLKRVSRSTTGNFARKGLLVSAVLIFGFTLWEGRDLVRASWDITYKAAYWRNKEVTVWQAENNPNVPKIGDIAPDFELTDVTGTTTMRLSDFRDKKPVVLLFGSFT